MNDPWPCFFADDWHGNLQAITPSDAAKALGVTTATVRRWAEHGYIRYQDEHGPHRTARLYSPADVTELVRLIDNHPNPTLQVLKRRKAAQPTPRALAQAINLVRTAYTEAMSKAGLTSHQAREIHIHANHDLIDHTTRMHQERGS